MSSVAVLETKIVLFARFGLDAVGLFEELLKNRGIVVVPLDDEMATAAFDAFAASARAGPSGSVEYHRLCGLCARQTPFPAFALQGWGRRPDGRSLRAGWIIETGARRRIGEAQSAIIASQRLLLRLARKRNLNA
jgi:hypothetical protein